MPRKFPLDLTGQRFNLLTVRNLAEKRNKTSFWLCICDCGRQTVVQRSNLISGSTKACGHLEHYGKHGHYRNQKATPEYRSWQDMLSRCKNPNVRTYKWYGGRGITVCERWNDFRNFLADMGLKPEGYTIERINNNGNYEPSNCKWIPRREQARNRRPGIRPKGLRYRRRPKT